ncbi:hypothetical protein CAFE_24340 [Caprobacter fermentans]|uniref:Uncharacterized protein n=1 Tax=Caproicibacter fermentans TaxID=2576756 RepID=A0A6N8I1T4_9FIRM|nr:hypothetical protein [Caproicibacter fermentans]MVB11710.1 hypothetical protein [Caproicibacter fermentans]OCN01067.1 hypothetical protein A7X67_06735 [Clostridium sp. W14A]
MRFFHADWVEVYLGTDYGEYLRKQTLLQNSGVKFKAKTRRNSRRFSINFPGAGSLGLTRGGLRIKDYYVILVPRENAVYAGRLLE